MNIDEWAEQAQNKQTSNWRILGPQLKKIREGRNMTASEVARRCFVTEQTIFRWESGSEEHKIPVTKIAALKVVLAVANSAADKVSGSETELTVEDLKFLEMMVSQSTTPITFSEAYRLLCTHRVR